MATEDSLIALGNLERLFAVFRKAERGEPINVGGIGGSITQGAGASAPHKRWLNIAASWFTDTFRGGGQCQARVINAGIGSTESPYGALRARAHLLAYNPDIVFVDYSVNNSRADIDSYNSLIRLLLEEQPSICVLPIMFSNAIGQGQYTTLIPLVRTYDLGVISYQAALQIYLDEGGESTHYSDDGVHPNDLGHAWAGQMVFYYLNQAKAAYDAGVRQFVDMPYPAPPADNSFQNTAFIEKDQLTTKIISGFAYDALSERLKATSPGQFVEYTVNVPDDSKIWVVAETSDLTSWGMLAVFVDDIAQRTITIRDTNWNYPKLNMFLAADGLTAGKHRIRFIVENGIAGANINIAGVGITARYLNVASDRKFGLISYFMRIGTQRWMQVPKRRQRQL